MRHGGEVSRDVEHEEAVQQINRSYMPFSAIHLRPLINQLAQAMVFITFMVAEDLHTGLGVGIVGRLEAETTDTWAEERQRKHSEDNNFITNQSPHKTLALFPSSPPSAVQRESCACKKPGKPPD